MPREHKRMQPERNAEIGLRPLTPSGGGVRSEPDALAPETIKALLALAQELRAAVADLEAEGLPLPGGIIRGLNQ